MQVNSFCTNNNLNIDTMIKEYKAAIGKITGSEICGSVPNVSEPWDYLFNQFLFGC